MNPDEKLQELGERLEVTEEELISLQKSKWNIKNIAAISILSSIPLLGAVMGYLIGNRDFIYTKTYYPYQIFLGPIFLPRERKPKSLRTYIGIRIVIILGILCFLIGFILGDKNYATSYTSSTRYGLWSK